MWKTSHSSNYISRNEGKGKFSCLMIPTEMVFSLDLCKCYIVELSTGSGSASKLVYMNFGSLKIIDWKIKGSVPFGGWYEWWKIEP